MLRVAQILDESLVNGEGIRMVFFFSGCKRNCKGCHNTDLQSFSVGKNYSVNELVNKAINSKMIDGVTLSGGDPIYQHEEILELCRELKKNNINIWMYTGETLTGVLEKNKALIKYIDVIVDGEFKEQLKGDFRYKGSSNQKIYKLNFLEKYNTLILKELEYK